MSLSDDERYMELALILAMKGNGWVNPNPLVGCVIVKDDVILATGYHHQYGCNHAEVDAIQKLDDHDLFGATLYVNLEPCSHTGKTPPCVDLIIQKKIKRVVIGTRDPNPLVHSVQKMQEAGVEVVTGVLEEECFLINRSFFWYITHQKPFVCLKIAMSIDGKIATASGESKYITGQQCREDTFWLRQRYSAIMVSSKTINHDRALLNIRMDDAKTKWRHPIKVILDRTLEIEMDQPILKTMIQSPIVLFTAKDQLNTAKANELTKLGVLVYGVNSQDGKLDLDEVLVQLGKLQIDSIIVEAGPTLAASFIAKNLANILRIYIGSTIIGGQDAPSAFADLGVQKLGDCKRMNLIAMKSLGDEIISEYNLKGGKWEEYVFRTSQDHYKS